MINLKPKELDNYNVHSLDAFEQAASENKTVKLPAPNQLFIDIDNETDYLFMLEQIEHIRQFEYVYVSSDTPSSSGLPKRHVVVEFERDLADVERIAYQAAMGSDRVREILGLVRVYMGDIHPTLFLERKEPILLPPSSMETINVDDVA